MLKTVSTQLALASDTLPEVLAKGNTTGGTDLAVSSGDDITFADNSKVIFGAGSDLSIYSDGTTGQVTGSVNVTGNVSSGGNIFVGNNLSLPYAAIKSSNTSGDFTITVSGLSTLSGGVWRKTSMLVYYSGIDGGITNGTDLLTIVDFVGLSIYGASVAANIVGTAAITTANPTNNSIDVTFDVSDSNAGSVLVFLLGGAQGYSPSIIITP